MGRGNEVARGALSIALSALLALGGVPARALAEAAEGAPIEEADVAGPGPEAGVGDGDPMAPVPDAGGPGPDAGGEGGVAGGLDPAGGCDAPADAGPAAEEGAPEPEPVEEGAAGPAAGPGDEAAPVAEEAPDPAAEASGGQAALAAQGASVASGTWGGCDWSVDAGGTLRVAPADGVSGQLADSRRWGGDDAGSLFPWYEHSARVRAVVLADGVALPQDCTGMFSGCTSLASLDASGWDTSGVEDMANMFYGCSSLKSLDVSRWDTSGVEDMRGMFDGCSSLKSLDVSRWDTSRVTDMTSMFYGCSKLSSLDVSRWDTSGVTRMDGMFYGCTSLASLGVSGWDTSGVEGMSFMFSGCSKLSSLDVSGWDTAKVEDMRGMFLDCSSLSSLGLSGWDTSRAADMSYMFFGCSKLSSLDVSGWDTSRVTDMEDMFYGCPSLRALRVGKGYAIGGADMFPESNASNGRWWSVSEGAWLARDEIVSKRSGVADTYRTAGGAERANPISARAARPSVSVAYGPAAARATPANVAVTGAVGALSYANASAGAGARRFRVDAGTGRVTVPRATPAGAYAVRVRVTAAGGPDCLPGSGTVSYEVVVRPAKASRPRTVARTSRGEVAVSWEAAKGAKTYQLQWRRAGAKRWTTVSVKGRKKTVTGLGRGALYEFRVRGVSGEARGKWSPASLRWLRGASKAKAAPGKAKGSIKATWGADKAATGGFKVFVYAKRGGKLLKTKAVKAGSTSATIKGLRSGRAYYVRVRPYRAEGGATYYGALSGWRAARAR